MAATSSFSVDDLIIKRLTIDGQRIQQLDLGALVESNPTYGVGIGTETPRLRLDISGTNGIRIPVGTTGQQPTLGNGIVDLSGVLRYNTELNQYEGWALDRWQAFGGSNLQIYNKTTNPKIQLTRAVTAYTGNTDGGVIEFRLKNSNNYSKQAEIKAIDTYGQAGYGSLVFSTNGGGIPLERMRIDHNGRVGIDKHTPKVSLDISGTDAIRIPYGTSGQRPANADASGCIRYNTQTSSFEGFGAGSVWGSLGGISSINKKVTITASDISGLQFLTGPHDGNSIPRMTILNNGYVGIGTPSPNQPLQVVGNITTTGGNFIGNLVGNAATATNVAYTGLTGIPTTWNQNTTGNAATATNVAFTGLTGTPTTWNQNTTGNAATATKLHSITTADIVQLASTQTLSNKTLTSPILNGNVGIGTSSPDNPLHIEKAHSNPNSSVIDTLLTLRTPPGSTDCSSDDAFKIGIDFISNDNIIGDGPPSYPYNNTTSRIVSMINPVGLNTAAHGTSQEKSSALAFYTSNNGTCAEKVRIDYDGNVGIGTQSPIAGLDIARGHVQSQFSGNSYSFGGSSGTGTYSSGASDWNASGSAGGWHLRVRGPSAFAATIQVYSDNRIKTNIVDVEDNQALQMVRNIPCRYYEYKDKLSRGTEKTIGFIAQEVKEVLPMAIKFLTAIIPNEMRKLENISWQEDSSNCKLTSDLQDVSGVKYRFYVSNDISENEVMKEIVGNTDNTFTFDQSWNNVFCYGKEVDDFHTLDKNKLFALNFSATQEIDKIQQTEKTKLETAEAKIATLENTLTDVLTRLSALE